MDQFFCRLMVNHQSVSNVAAVESLQNVCSKSKRPVHIFLDERPFVLRMYKYNRIAVEHNIWSVDSFVACII